jgi:anti-sigma-K factor RskA
MNYADPKLRELLAGEYVLGTMPSRARARFERLMRDDAGLRQLVGDWEAHFAPIDGATSAEAPPARVWQGILERLPAAPPAETVASFSLWRSLSLWRGLAAGCFALAVTLVLYINVVPPPPAATPAVVAVLNGKDGKPAWIATTGARPGEFLVAAITPQALAAKHSFELWGIAGGPPQPLGILAPEPDQRLVLTAAQMPAAGGVLAVSLEPEGGSPTGGPTGPVLYQGEVLARKGT